MSRYTCELPNGRVIAYGYDGPLCEYFLQEYYAPNEVENPNHDIVFSISNYWTMVPHPEFPNKETYDRQDMIKMYQRYPQIPESVITLMALDLPI
jgi:hypothetical protein